MTPRLHLMLPRAHGPHAAQQSEALRNSLIQQEPEMRERRMPRCIMSSAPVMPMNAVRMPVSTETGVVAASVSARTCDLLGSEKD
jgi:hypothetical protein